MSYESMSFEERMSIIQMFYMKRMKPTEIASRLNPSVSTIARELNHSSDYRQYNSLLAEYDNLLLRRY